MSDGIDWGYAQHDLSTRDVTDREEWRLEERWAVDDALTWASLEQRPATAASAAGPGFMAFFERMLDANLHVPLERCTNEQPDPPADDPTTQEGLDVYQ